MPLCLLLLLLNRPPHPWSQSSNPKIAFEGFAAPREGSLVRTKGHITTNEPHGSRQYYHQSDDMLVHYDYALKTGMKAR